MKEFGILLSLIIICTQQLMNFPTFCTSAASVQSGRPVRCEGKGGRFSWKGTFELIYTKRCLQNIGSWTSRNHLFYLLDDTGVRGGSPPGDCAILGASWLHFLRFLKQIRKIIALTFLTFSLFRQANPLNWKGTFSPLASPGKGQRGRLSLLPRRSSGVPECSIANWPTIF
jgi:hypothetical protein